MVRAHIANLERCIGVARRAPSLPKEEFFAGLLKNELGNREESRNARRTFGELVDDYASRPRKSVMASEVIASKMTPMP
jgi:hypothetical protein